MKLTNFKIKTKEDVVVSGEYEGNINSKKVIIFSHGFGVTRSSHGMFNEIGDKFKKDYVVVRFDYNLVNNKENWTKVYPYSAQVEMLNTVHKLILQKFNPKEINIIGHSSGCLIVGMAKLTNIENTFLLATPTVSPYKDLKEYFLQRPQTVINEGATSVIKRSDGSLTYVKSNFWNEMKNVNPVELYKNLAKTTNVVFIKALQDQVLAQNNYNVIKEIPGVGYYKLQSNHDFQGDSRKQLITIIETILK